MWEILGREFKDVLTNFHDELLITFVDRMIGCLHSAATAASDKNNTPSFATLVCPQYTTNRFPAGRFIITIRINIAELPKKSTV